MLGSFQRAMSCFRHRALRDQQQPTILIPAHKLQPRLATGRELLALVTGPGRLHVLLQRTGLVRPRQALTFLSTLSRVSGRLMSKQMSTASESG